MCGRSSSETGGRSRECAATVTRVSGDLDLQPVDDRRRPFRLYVDVLATPAQIERLQTVIGEALCAAPDDHNGPCRIAWSLGRFDSDHADVDGSGGLTPDDVAHMREHLEPIPVWPEAEVDRSLGV